jgi:upstream activation factor subunit UAF30
MPRQSKSKTEVTATTPAVNTPVIEQVAATVEKTVKAKKETKPKASKIEAVSAPVSDAPIVTLPVIDAAEADAADLAAQSTEFLAKLNQLGALLASLKTEYRSLEKKWSRELKTAQKSSAKRKRKSGNRQPSGFVKPTKISDELAKFLEKPTGTEMARTDVTREINKYIRSHNLQDKENGRKINPDAKLQTLLKLKTTDELTYFNLQRYMSPHFHKAEKALVAPVATA